MATPRSISTIKSFAVLRAFCRRGEVLTNAQISRRTGLPPSSVRRLLLTLSEIGGVELAGQARYRLGPLLHALGRSANVPDCLLGAAREPLWGLHRRLGLTVTMAVLDGHMTRYLEVLAPAGRCHVEKDARYESYSSAIGRVLLASLPKAQLDKFLAEGDLVALTPFTVTAPSLFRAELESVRRRGFATECEETQLGLGCVAAPVTDDYGRTVAAICVSDDACRLSARRIPALAAELTAAAGAIRGRLFPSVPLRAAPRRVLQPSAHAKGAPDLPAPCGIAAE